MIKSSSKSIFILTNSIIFKYIEYCKRTFKYMSQKILKDFFCLGKESIKIKGKCIFKWKLYFIVFSFHKQPNILIWLIIFLIYLSLKKVRLRSSFSNL